MAVGHSLLVTGYHMNTKQMDYKDLGNNYFDERNKETVRRRMVKRLEQLGYQVELKPASATAV
jgi:alpha-D-ribose 1-methylphosphonate 5-phosphate C-P lyase